MREHLVINDRHYIKIPVENAVPLVIAIGSIEWPRGESYYDKKTNTFIIKPPENLNYIPPDRTEINRWLGLPS